MELFVKFALKFTKPEYGTKAIELLTPNNFKSDNWKFESAFGNFKLEEFYLDMLSEAKILPTVNYYFGSIKKDNPKLIVSEFPDAFKGEQFKDLLQLLKTSEINNLIKRLASKNKIDLFYTEETLCDKINKTIEIKKIEDKVKVFLWCCEEYPNSENIPNLLKDTNDNWITKRKKIYLPTDTGISILPEELDWVDLRILRQDYVTALIQQIKNKNIEKWNNLKLQDNDGDKRILDRYSKNYLKVIELTEQSSLDLMLSEINNQIKTYENSKSFIQWFYSNYKDKELGDVVKEKIKFMLPIRDNGICEVKNVFIGKEYGNELGETLFANSNYKALCFHISKNYNRDEYLNFMISLGVLRFPKIYKKTVIDSDFKKYVSDKYPSNHNNNYLQTYIIDNFEKILQNTNFCLILQWIMHDIDIYNYITGYSKDSNYTQQTNWTGIYFPSNEWFIYILRQTKWIEINGQKYAPEECLFIDKSQEILKKFYPCIDDNFINELLVIIKNTDIDIIKNIFQIIGVKNKIWDLNSNDFYKILLKLPEYDESGKISKSIYTNINKYNISFTNSNNKTEFLENGKLYAKNRMNEMKYIKNSNVFFTSTVVLNAENKWMLAVNDRTGNFEYYQKHLGIQEYKKEKIEIINKIPHLYNNDFQKDFESFKIFAFSYRVDNVNQDEINIFKKININLCSNINVEGNINIINYFPIEINRNEWLIKVSNNIDKYELSKVITNIFNIVLKGVDIVNQKFRELFDAENPKREKIIEDNLGYEYIDRAKKFYLVIPN